MVKENIEILKKFDRKHKNKDINNHKVKFSLTTKVIILNVGLTIVLIALIANPVSYLMMENQEEILTTGLQKRITVLMESISNGAKAYLPTENILELNLIANQSDTLAEAEYVTILSYHTDTHGINSDIDYVWASNDKNILKKIDTHELLHGESKINIPEIKELIQKFENINSEAKYKVKKTSEQIVKLVQEYQNAEEGNDNISKQKRHELEILITDLKTKRETELHELALQNLGSFPYYDLNSINNKNTKYLFYLPILYQERMEENFLKGIVLIEANTENLIDTIKINKKDIFLTVISISAIGIIIGTIISLFLSFYIVKPIKVLQNHVTMIKNTANKAELFNKKVYINTKDELGVLSENINEMTENLANAAIYESMLLGGKQVQRSFIPLDTIDNVNKTKLSVGHIENENVQFFGYYEGAKGVSGDFFDFKQLDEKYFALIKCDVSGKGAPAALIMAEVSALFCDFFRNWSFEKDGINLQELVYKINDHLDSRNLKGKFAAFTLGLFDTISGDIYFCNAGDNVIFIYDSINKQQKEINLPSTPATGTFPSLMIKSKGGYPIVKIHLNKNDILFLYTDGIEDSKRFFRNDEGEIQTYIPNTDKLIDDNDDNNGIDSEYFGKERIKKIINAVLLKEKYKYTKKVNPIKSKTHNIVFDFKNIEGTPEDVIMALVSVEKIFRLYHTSSVKSYDYAVVDKKIDKFLQLYFNRYDALFTQKVPHPNPDMKDEYLYYTEMKEEEQTDDLTLVAIKKK